MNLYCKDLLSNSSIVWRWSSWNEKKRLWKSWNLTHNSGIQTLTLTSKCFIFHIPVPYWQTTSVLYQYLVQGFETEYFKSTTIGIDKNWCLSLWCLWNRGRFEARRRVSRGGLTRPPSPPGWREGWTRAPEILSDETNWLFEQSTPIWVRAPPGWVKWEAWTPARKPATALGEFSQF